MDVLNVKGLTGLLRVVADRIIAERDALTQLDAAIGDGDFGQSLSTGFGKVQDQLNALEGADVGGVLKKVGITLTGSVGGVSGPIWGTAFLRAGMKAGSQMEVDLQQIVERFAAALEGIQARGGAQLGDKTLVDALYPAMEAMREVAGSGGGIEEAFQKGLEAARKGSDDTIDMIAKKGRASYLGERTRGHRDSGSWAIVIVFDEIVRNLS